MTLDSIVREVIERAVREALAGPLEGAGSSIDRCTLLTVQETCQKLGITRPMVQRLYGLHWRGGARAGQRRWRGDGRDSKTPRGEHAGCSA